MATSSRDRKIRLFNVLSGKIIQVIDESLDYYSAIQQVLFAVFYLETIYDLVTIF
jgi:hypothetical protein